MDAQIASIRSNSSTIVSVGVDDVKGSVVSPLHHVVNMRRHIIIYGHA